MFFTVISISKETDDVVDVGDDVGFEEPGLLLSYSCSSIALLSPLSVFFWESERFFFLLFFSFFLFDLEGDEERVPSCDDIVFFPVSLEFSFIVVLLLLPSLPRETSLLLREIRCDIVPVVELSLFSTIIIVSV